MIDLKLMILGMMLWGRVTKNENLEHLAQLMMKVNARSIKTYFLMTEDNIIHPKEIKRNKVTGSKDMGKFL